MNKTNKEIEKIIDKVFLANDILEYCKQSYADELKNDLVNRFIDFLNTNQTKANKKC